MDKWTLRAKARMAELGLTQEQLADRLGVTQGAIGHWLNGRREPKLAMLRAIMAALDLPLDSSSAAVSANGIDPTPLHFRGRPILVVGMAKLGTEGFLDTPNWATGQGEGYVNIPSDDPDAYALKVVGDSMHPRIKNGEYVVVEPNKAQMPGDEVMVQTADGRSMIKEFLYERDGMIRLLNINDSHPAFNLERQQVLKIHVVGAIIKSSRYMPFQV